MDTGKTRDENEKFRENEIARDGNEKSRNGNEIARDGNEKSRDDNEKSSRKGPDSNKKYKCSACTYSCDRKEDFKIHMRLHTGKKSYKCHLCDYSVTRKSCLDKHVQIHMQPMKCHLCNFYTDRIPILKDHLVNHNKNTEMCNACTSALFHQSHLRSHMLVQGGKPYKCPDCNYNSSHKCQCHVEIHKRVCDENEKSRDENKNSLDENEKSRDENENSRDENENSRDENENSRDENENSRDENEKRSRKKPDSNKKFKCSICTYLSVTKGHLKIHMRTHTGEKPYKCHLCSYSAAKKGNLDRHVKGHIQLTKCPHCDFSTDRNRILQQHLTTWHDEKEKTRDENEKSRVENEKRSRKEPDSNKKFKCSTCTYSSVSKGHLKIHMRTHTGEKPYKCHLCDYRATIKSSVNKHMITHQPIKCHLCDFCTDRTAKLKHHLLVTHNQNRGMGNTCGRERKLSRKKPDSNKKFQCSTCTYSCVRKEHLKLHIRTHTGEKPYKCHLCDYCATQKSTLDTHIKTHQPIKCHLCDFNTDRKIELSHHLLVTHKQDREMCNICGRAFYHESHLKKHMLLHKREKTYKCHFCDYWATQKSTVDEHMIKHQKIKCPLCNFYTDRKSKLKYHLLVIHRSIGNICCGRAFYHESQLKEHMRAHTKENPYKCPYCNYKSSQMCHVASHKSICQVKKMATGKTRDGNKNSRDENEKSRDENEKSRDGNENSQDVKEKSQDVNEKSRDGNEKPSKKGPDSNKIYQCGLRTYSSDRQQHVTDNHHVPTDIKEKLFKCSDCDRFYNKIGSLQIHERTHKADKPYNTSFNSYKNAYKLQSNLELGLRPYLSTPQPPLAPLPSRFTETTRVNFHSISSLALSSSTLPATSHVNKSRVEPPPPVS